MSTISKQANTADNKNQNHQNPNSSQGFIRVTTTTSNKNNNRSLLAAAASSGKNNNNNLDDDDESIDENADEQVVLVTAGFVPVQGPVDPRDTLIVFDIPFAPLDPKKSVKLRQRLSLPPEADPVENRVVELLDRLIPPREWTDENNTRWEQHASPYPSPRADVVRTQAKLQTMMRQQGAKETGICHIRSALYSECFLEVLRQAIAENWERGLLLLSLHSHISERQKTHRELFESRIGFSFRLALCSDRDTASMRKEIAFLEQKREELVKEEERLKKACDDAVTEMEEQVRVDEKLRSDEMQALKKESNQKRAVLEVMTAPTHRNI